jgi:mannose-6-phosphate isomerase-like protein (cupin superfamily)
MGRRPVAPHHAGGNPKEKEVDQHYDATRGRPGTASGGEAVGEEIWWAQTDAYAGKLLHVKAGHRLSLQLHREKDESSYVLSGRLRLTRGTNAEDLRDEAIGRASRGE